MSNGYRAPEGANKLRQALFKHGKCAPTVGYDTEVYKAGAPFSPIFARNFIAIERYNPFNHIEDQLRKIGLHDDGIKRIEVPNIRVHLKRLTQKP